MENPQPPQSEDLKTTPLDELTPKQLEVMKALETELGVDKLMVSFTIDGRTEDGQKRSAFISATVAKQDGRAVGWTPQEMHAVSCIMGKHVAVATFRDARTRRIVLDTKELADILTGYDRHLVRILKKLSD